MNNALIRKLESFEALSDGDRAALSALSLKTREVGPRTDLISVGDNPEDVHLILDGYACRYKLLDEGQRQIMAVLVPGDFCDLNVFILDQMDHTIGTVSQCQIVKIPRKAIEEIMANHPAITKAFWWCSLVDEAVLREWLVNIGGRPSNHRIAHVLCEIFMRLDAVGRVTGNSYTFPFTQMDIADMTGITQVHVNRTMRELKNSGLITLKQRVLTIHDVGQLKAYCNFNQNYLHLKNARWSDRRNVPWPKLAQDG